jgi:hypothetical protein
MRRFYQARHNKRGGLAGLGAPSFAMRRIANADGSKLHPQKMKHAKGELKARPSHPPLAGRLLIGSLRSAITSRSEHVDSR